MRCWRGAPISSRVAFYTRRKSPVTCAWRSAVSARTTLTELSDFLGDPLDLEVATIARARGDGTPELRALSLADDAETFFADIIAKRVAAQLDPLGWSVKKLDPL